MRMMVALLSVGLLVLLATGCADKSPLPPPRLPDNELGAYREAVMTVGGHLVLRDSAYVLELSRDEAVEMGVPVKYYDRILQEIEYTNHWIAESNRQGVPVDLTDVGAEYRR